MNKIVIPTKEESHNLNNLMRFLLRRNDKVQLVFREMGFYFTQQELQLFKRCIEDSYFQNKCCEDCELKNKCHKFLLKTPCSQIDLAVSMEELDAVKDLVEGTLFKINLDDYLYGEGMN